MFFRKLFRSISSKQTRPGVNFVGQLDAVMGLSTSARGYVDALLHAGVPVNVIDIDDGVEGRGRVAVDYPTARRQPVNIVHMTLAHLQSQQLLEQGPLAKMVQGARYNIGIVYWELERLLPEWAPIIARFDEFWCASSFLARAMSASFSGPVRVVRPAIGGGAKQPTVSRAALGLPEDRFVFFYSADAGSILGRKNPRAFIDAYVDEFAADEGACCFVKIHYGKPGSPDLDYIRQVANARDDVIFSDRVFSVDDMNALFAHIDCYVSPHRSEGLGLTVLEAMLAQKPVIATPYGGVEDFVSADTALPLAFRVVEVGPGNEPYPAHEQWADPLPESIRASMRKVFADRNGARTIAENGFHRVQDLFSIGQTASEIDRELSRIGGILRDGKPRRPR